MYFEQQLGCHVGRMKSLENCMWINSNVAYINFQILRDIPCLILYDLLCITTYVVFFVHYKYRIYF